jgi:hypothetical protein
MMMNTLQSTTQTMIPTTWIQTIDLELVLLQAQWDTVMIHLMMCQLIKLLVMEEDINHLLFMMNLRDILDMVEREGLRVMLVGERNFLPGDTITCKKKAEDL